MHPNETALNDYIDGALGQDERAGVERHLESCVACRQLIDDLRDIRNVAAKLELRDPPARAWMRLERAIKLEAEARSTHGTRRSPGGFGQRVLHSRSVRIWLAAAAVLAVATVVGLRFTPDGARPASKASSRSPAPSRTSSIHARRQRCRRTSP